MARWHCKRIGINGRGNALRSGKSGNRVTVLACSEAPISPDSPEASTSSSEASSAPATASRAAVGQHSQMHGRPVRCSCLRHKLHAFANANVHVTCRSSTFNAPHLCAQQIASGRRRENPAVTKRPCIFCAIVV